ncbi:MAG: alkylated DNA repair dioxygenase AlkB [Enterobacterales bacterium]|jgi:alkylated DNA repair dioxygenase AlkB
MDLFDNKIEQPIALISTDGDVKYYAAIMDMDKADYFMQALFKNISWENDQARILGKHILTKRKVAWYGDKPFQYTYSNNTKEALHWIPELLELKALVEAECNETFNSCLANLYHDGSEGMAWHSDGEKDLKENGAIGSLSFGAERKFAFKHKETKETLSLKLAKGSLLIMNGCTQKHWMHRLPPTKLVSEPRINLTFRTIEKN